MKRYEFVNVKMGGFFSSHTEEHRRVINEYAAKGYTYAGHIPTHIDVDGKISKMDLIFEVPEDLK